MTVPGKDTMFWGLSMHAVVILNAVKDLAVARDVLPGRSPDPSALPQNDRPRT